MTGPTHWLALFTGTTWEEHLAAGGTVVGFPAHRWATVQQMRPGDLILGYLTGVSRWIAVLEVAAKPYQDDSRIWQADLFPCRVSVTSLARLTPETAVPVVEMREELSLFRDLKTPFAWGAHFRGAPKRLRDDDGEAVVRAVRAAESDPVTRPVDARKLARPPRALRASIGVVVVPEPEPEPEPKQGSPAPPQPREATAHDEIQWLLLRLGNDMGLDVWVARNDRGKVYEGRRFADLPRLKSELPLQFDEATNRTIELIDVLWLRGNAIVAAFEIESTTAIYSGLLRMADLIAMQPNLNIPLYIVAPDERREKVKAEINRPTFSRLSPPMRQMCRFIAFSSLRERVATVAAVVRYLRPEFLEELSESCEVEEA